ncbi:octopamine receptor 1-like [Mercenaria mercenaria]|uniref:octopamine receptor 1-like n=1 Tax=Mercenaria mercenaria TaxID=6596 RepID=UPI00234EDEF9|nr:octopamine receptor 1-like [Mercenaria mercenaria]
MNYNSSNSCEEVTFVEHGHVTKWIVLSIGGVFVVFTIIFNLIVIVKINRKCKLKSFTKYFLTSLASVDLCVGVTLMPFNIINELYGLRKTAGLLFCDFVNSLDYTLCTASVIFLTTLTFDRYIALCKPFKYHKFCNKKTIVIITVSSWMSVLTISFVTIPTGLVYYGVPEDVIYCITKEGKSCTFLMSKYFAIISSTISLLMPGIIITCLNVKLSRNVRRQNNIRVQLTFHRSTRAFINRRNVSQGIHVAKTIAVLTGAFICCWMPFFIVLNVSVFSEYRLSYGIYVIANWLGYLNSTINPLLYLLLEGRSCIGRH